MMNGTFPVRAADRFAARLETESKTVPDRIRLGYRLAFGRSPNESESTRAEKFIAEQGLPNFTWALLNSNEFLYLK